jgi:hypothetical protein
MAARGTEVKTQSRACPSVIAWERRCAKTTQCTTAMRKERSFRDGGGNPTLPISPVRAENTTKRRKRQYARLFDRAGRLRTRMPTQTHSIACRAASRRSHRRSSRDMCDRAHGLGADFVP